MKSDIIILFAGLLAIISCQKRQEVVADSPMAPLTRSVDSFSKSDSYSVSKEEALKIVEPITGKYPDRWVDISNEVISAGTRIAYNSMGRQVDVENRSYCQSPDYDSWLLVIDKDFSILGRQHLIHIFVDAESGFVTTMELDGRAIVEWDTSRNIYVSPEKTSGIDCINDSRPPERSGTATRWAVIISGGCDMYNNRSEFYNDCVNVYVRLTQYLGYPKGNIFCLIADGQDTTIDQRTDFITYINSSPDLDSDGVNDVQYRANKSSISAVFDNLSLLVDPGDEVFVFMTDNGDTGGCFYLWDNETLYPSDLDTELDKLGASVMIDVVMGQSYSGEYISTLSASNRTIATSCLSTESAMTAPFVYTDFLHYWTEHIYPSISSGDCYVSPYELFLGAKVQMMHSSSQSPQYNSTPTDFGQTHSLAGELIPYVSGSDYLSTDINTLYSIVNYPNPSSVTWSVGHNVSLVSHTDSTAVLKGLITYPGHYCESATNVTATIVVNGKTHSLVKPIESVWKPGICFDGNNIWGSNGNYQVRHIGGESGYSWGVDNSAWVITGYNDYTVNIIENYTNNPVNLYVSFYNPLGDMITVRDRVH